MGKINVLGFDVANLIAAGEVVERPSSVLKELLENSIDAGATSIVAEIKRGGVSLIRVTDNGCGIEKEDLPIALERHATSKIRAKEDLDSIMTLGFRGEALAAISSVCSMTVITRTKESEIGHMLTAEAGKVIDIDEVGCAVGTTVVVSELFYNVPARRKFLKKDATEAMNVTALVEKVALSRPDISIQLLIDGEEKFKTPGDGELYNTVSAVFGREFASKTVKVEGDTEGINVSGYIGRSDNVKKNRNMMNVFLNGRYVKSLTAQAAIEKAYTSYIAPECFPTCVLFIKMNPSLVDINVHPAKLECKFADERQVFEAVYYTVKTKLEELEYRPELEIKKSTYDPKLLNPFVPLGQDTKGEQISIKEPVIQRASDAAPKKNDYSFSSYTKRSYDGPLPLHSARGTLREGSDKEMTPKKSFDFLRRYSEAPITDIKVEVSPKHEYRLIGEAFNCYVIIEYEGAMLIIDKHAAHERVIFEDLKKKQAEDGRIASQLLLLPITVIPGAVGLSLAEEFREEFAKVGFEYTVNPSSVDITSVPEAISQSEAEALFLKMLTELEDGVGDPKLTNDIRREKALYQVACKAAIKGGRVYDGAIIKWLIDKLLDIPDITVCPHGRPVAMRLTKAELDRQFDRIK